MNMLYNMAEWHLALHSNPNNFVNSFERYGILTYGSDDICVVHTHAYASMWVHVTPFLPMSILSLSIFTNSTSKEPNWYIKNQE